MAENQVDKKTLKEAQEAYKVLLKSLDKKKWEYDKDEETMSVTTGAKCKNSNYNLRIRLNTSLGIVSVLLPLSFVVPEEKRAAVSVAVSRANWGTVDGSFDYNLKNGKIIYRMTTCFSDCKLDSEVFEYLIGTSFSMADHYYLPLKEVAEKDLSFRQIVDMIDKVL